MCLILPVLVHPRRFLRRVDRDGPLVLRLLLHTTATAATGSAAHGQQPVNRPRVGLALGGGPARGIAHVGVLEWLEEHRIPVDAIAGTIMGGACAAAMLRAERPPK